MVRLGVLDAQTRKPGLAGLLYSLLCVKTKNLIGNGFLTIKHGMDGTQISSGDSDQPCSLVIHRCRAPAPPAVRCG